MPCRGRGICDASLGRLVQSSAVTRADRIRATRGVRRALLCAGCGGLTHTNCPLRFPVRFIRSESRRRGRERAYAELITATNGDDHCAQRSRQLEQVMDLCNDVTWSSRDQRTLHRFLEGERNPAVLASVLGVSNRSPHEQRAEIKRFKDRVIKRLRRLVQATRSQQTM